MEDPGESRSRAVELAEWIVLGCVAIALPACSGGSGGSGNAAPVASFTIDVTSGDAPLQVQVDASASSDPDGVIVEYAWDFGDGTTAQGIQATHVYRSESTYPLRLTVADDLGKTGTSKVDVEVTPPPVHYVGLYGSNLIGVEDLLLVLDDEAGVVSGWMQDAAGRTGTVTGTSAGNDLELEVTWTTPGCPGGLDVQGTLVAGGLELTFTGADCEGVHVGGTGQLLSEPGEVVAFAQPHPVDLEVQGGDLFWSSDGAEPLQRFEPDSGTLTGLAPRVGALRGLTYAGGAALWTEVLESGVGGCGSQSATVALRRSTDGSQVETLDVALSCSPDVSSDIVVADGKVYWALQTGSSPDRYAIRRTPLDGSPPDSPVETDQQLTALAADGQHLYWSEESIAIEPSRVQRIPLQGGPAEEIFSTDERPLSIAVGAAEVVIAERFQGVEGGNLWSVPKAGGAPTPLATFTSTPRRVVVSGTTLGWATQAEVGTLALPGGPAVPLAQTLAPAVDVVFDGDRLAWIESEPLCCGGRLRAVRLVGGAALELAELVSPLRLARAPDGTLLWIEGGEDPASDPALRVRTALGEVATWLAGLQRSPALAVDDSDVYFVQGWWIKRVPRAGGTPERFARADFYIADVALDDDHVYWLVDDPLGTVQRRPKAGGPVEFVSTGNGASGALVVGAGQALWVEMPDKVRAAPVTGGASTLFASGIEFPTDLVTDGEFAYFNAQDAGLLRRKPLAGGAIEELGGFGGGSLSTLWVDGVHLYAVDQTEVGRFPKDGGPFEPGASISNDVFEAGSVAAANGYVYWTDTLLGAVVRLYMGP